MANFLSNVLGNDGIAKMAGDKVGDLVEDTLKNVLAGKEQEGGETKDDNNSDNKGGFNVGDALSSAIGGKNDDDKGGFNVGDALSAIGGKKEEGGGGGLDVTNALGGFFK